MNANLNTVTVERDPLDTLLTDLEAQLIEAREVEESQTKLEIAKAQQILDCLLALLGKKPNH